MGKHFFMTGINSLLLDAEGSMYYYKYANSMFATNNLCYSPALCLDQVVKCGEILNYGPLPAIHLALTRTHIMV
jgi:hypothetical protein